MKMEDHILRQIVGHVYWKDREGRYLGCNHQYAAVFGYSSPAEMIGKTDAYFIKNEVHLQNLIKIDQTVINSGTEKTLEKIGLDREGNAVLYLTKKAPLFDENNNIIGLIGTSINASGYFDMKDYIIRHTTGNVYWKDVNGRYLGCNDAFAEMVGLATPFEIVGKTDAILFKHMLDAAGLKRLNDLDKKILISGEGMTIEEEGVDKEGRRAFYMTRKVPMKDTSNNIVGLIGTSIDITKQREAEAIKLEFLRNMSHDIMAPFSGILGISRMLHDDETDPDKKISLNYLILSSERLLTLFKQILEVSEVSGQQLKLEEFDIRDVVVQTTELVGISARQKNIYLHVDCPSVVIKSDKLRVTRILLNLLGNAIKFTDVGGIRVVVEYNPHLRISVMDTGSGIPEDKLEVIFDKFRKLTESGKNHNFMGSGIGLFIAKQFSLDLGGDIIVESEVGKGSKFTFFTTKKFD